MTLIAYNDGIDMALVPPDEVAGIVGGDRPEVAVGWTNANPDWFADMTGVAFMANGGVGRAISEGRVDYLPMRLSSIPRYFTDVRRPNVVVIAGVRRGDDLAFRGTVGWGYTAALLADQVVVEVDEDAFDLGAPPIPGNIVATLARQEGATLAPPRQIEDAELAVAQSVLSVLPDDPTIQIGPGGVAEAILRSLDRPVSVWTGVITDAVAELGPRRLLTGKATAGYTWGGSALDELADDGKLRLLPVERTHEIATIGSIDRFVALNAALQVGLDGSVNIERVGKRLVSGIGGHADFCLGASRSEGGLSIIALRSTTRGGDSTIVPNVDVVSTPRTDVDMVVTEHGVADIRGASTAARAELIASVAAPEHQAMLLDASSG
ncbi:MAG: acetyl-CoA hydrolase/transferase C-terminal domain-containing protein [Acidimicrobiales bacterium]